MLSWPHFFQADPKLIRDVEGLSPNKEKHQFHIEVQPVSVFCVVFFYKKSKYSMVHLCTFQKLGNGLSGKIRTQVNIQMNKHEGIKAAEGMRDILLPVMWMSDDLDKITDNELVQKIKEEL